MNPEKDYININRESWNKKTKVHIQSEFYNNESFLEGRNSLNDIELNLLGDIKGKSILHLQCHFGQDSISLARLGAKVTAVDFSDQAINYAQKINEQLGTDVHFICSDIYELPNILNQKFDLVFTSYGTIGWLPDLDKWAKLISEFLKPNGKFIFVEFHPVVWMFDDDFQKVAYTYAKSEAIVENFNGTYADTDSEISQHTISWNHSLSEVFSALLNQNLSLNNFQEYDYSPYNCFNHIIEFEPGKFRIKHLENKIPMVYSLVFQKK